MKRYEGSPVVVIERRKGTPDSPFSNMNESLVVAEDGKVLLSEIPNELNRVVVTGDNKTWYEVKQGELTDNAFKVDYINKLVTFNIAHVGKQLHFKYVGEGNHYYSPHSIYTRLEDGDVVETLGELIEKGESALDGLTKLDEKLGEVTQATNNANTATSEAHSATINANTAASSANAAKTVAETATNNANTATSEAHSATINANLATTSANEATVNAILAKNNAEIATASAIEATNNVNTVINEVKSVGEFVLSTPYKKNNTVLNNGSSWIALQDTQDNPLPVLPIKENMYWRLVAQRGIDGTGSVSTVNGQAPDVNGNVSLTIDKVEVLNSLASTSTTSAVSANKAKELNDRLVTVEGISDATVTKNGYMTTTQVAKLNGIETGANNTTVVNNLTSTSTTSALSAKQGKELSNQIGILTGDLSTTNIDLTALDDRITSRLDMIMEQHKKIEVLPSDPVGEDLYEGRIWILKAIIDNFIGANGTIPKADLWLTSTSGAGSALLNGNGAVEIKSIVENPDASILLRKDRVIKESKSRKLKFKNTVIYGNMRIGLVFGNTAPSVNVNSNWNGQLGLNHNNNGLANIFYKSSTGTMNWSQSKHVWETSTTNANISLSMNTVYTFTLETTATQFRIIIKNENETISIIQTSWVNWSDVLMDGTNMWLYFGEPLTDHNYGTMLVSHYKEF